MDKNTCFSVVVGIPVGFCFFAEFAPAITRLLDLIPYLLAWLIPIAIVASLVDGTRGKYGWLQGFRLLFAIATTLASLLVAFYIAETTPRCVHRELCFCDMWAFIFTTGIGFAVLVSWTAIGVREIVDRRMSWGRHALCSEPEETQPVTTV